MNQKVIVRITIVSFIVGFMIAVQFNTVHQPTARDTRDIWEIRQELSHEKKRHSELLTEIMETSNMLKQYEDSKEHESSQALNDTVNRLREQVGLSDVSGPGVVLKVTPSFELMEFGYEIKPISPHLLIRLVNEIYRFNGVHIEIDGQRIIYNTAIRTINGVTTINGIPINETDVEIRIITKTFEEAEKLYSYLYSSTFRDDFYIDNLNLIINNAQTDITISAYDGELNSTLQSAENSQ